MIERKTQFSPCRKYRYTLWREWAVEDLLIGECSAETKDDPTIRRCSAFAKRWGFGALCMTNLFAWRDTKPENMKKAPLPAGIDNHHWILKCASEAGLVLAAWGKNGSFQNQDINVQQWLSSINVPLHCLRKNGDGSPEHPLYIPADTLPVIWTPTPEPREL